MTAFYDHLSSPRILRGKRADIWLATYLDGKETAPSAPAPTVSVANLDGTVIASGTATIANKRAKFTLTAAQTAISNQLIATWSNVIMDADPAFDATTYHEITGDVLFTLPEARIIENAALKSETAYPNAVILEARDRIWDEFEGILGYALGRRVRVLTLSGSGYEDLWLPPDVVTIRSIETRYSGTWTAFDSVALADSILDGGRLTRETLGYWPSGRGNIRVTYEAGTAPISRELKRAALVLLKEQLVPSIIPARATHHVNENGGQYSLSTPGLKGALYGVPEVDVVLNRLKSHAPAFA